MSHQDHNQGENKSELMNIYSKFNGLVMITDNVPKKYINVSS
jgi:hypothetical protein